MHGDLMGDSLQLPFLARNAEIESLKALVRAAKEGKSSVLFLEGEPGIGKTRIMKELSHLSVMEGMIALAGRCYGKAVPYSPWLEMVYEYSPTLSKDKLSRLTAGLPQEFSSIIFEIGGPVSGGQLGIRAWLKGPSRSATSHRTRPKAPEAEDRIRLFEGFLRFFTNISGEKPIVLFIDDLHLADSATVQLLRYFAGKIPSRRISIVGAYDNDQLNETDFLSETLQDLKREGLCKVTRVEPLNLDETRQLMEAVVGSVVSDQVLVQSVFRISQGNPFFVREFASTLTSKVSGSHQSSTGLPWMSPTSVPLELPTSIRALVKRKLVKLTPEAIETLAIASLIGVEFNLDLLRPLTQINEDTLLQHLENSVKESVISEAPSAKQVLYRFNHPLIREVLAEDLGVARRRRYHRMIAQAMERLQGPESERLMDLLAFHYLESGDEQKAVDFTLRAANRAVRMLAYDEAAHHLSNALELCEIPDLRRRISEDIALVESKKQGWRRFLEEEAFKIGTAGYDSIGEKYERLVAPVFEPIAKPIAEWAEPKPGQHVLDAGTGTGLLAFMIAPTIGPGGHVLGVDISQGMLSVARRKGKQKGLSNAEFKLMDNSNLTLPDAAFDLAVSSFGLPPFNADRAISEIYRILKPHRVFVFDEWESTRGESKPGVIFEETLCKFRTTNPTEKLVTIREAASYRGRGFSKLWGKATLMDWLKKAGFARADNFKRSHEIRSTSFEDFYEYQAAWWTVDAELQEMSEDGRKRFVEALREAITPFMDSKGLLERVEVNYFKAYKD